MSKRDPAEVVHRALIAANSSLAVAESLTSGHLQALISARSGASKFFRGGVTVYTIPMKARLLGVDREAAERCDAVSPQVAMEMAQGVCRLFSAEFGIATTGYAEPQEEPAVIEPYAHVAIVSGNSGRLLFEGIFRGAMLKRERMQRATAEFAVKAFANLLENPASREALKFD